MSDPENFDLELLRTIGRLHGEKKDPVEEPSEIDTSVCWGIQNPETGLTHSDIFGCERPGCPKKGISKSPKTRLESRELVGVTPYTNTDFGPSRTSDSDYVAICKCKGCSDYYGHHIHNDVADDLFQLKSRMDKENK